MLLTEGVKGDGVVCAGRSNNDYNNDYNKNSTISIICFFTLIVIAVLLLLLAIFKEVHYNYCLFFFVMSLVPAGFAIGFIKYGDSKGHKFKMQI